MQETQKDSYIRIRIPIEMKEQLDALRKKRAINISELVRILLDDYLKKNPIK